MSWRNLPCVEARLWRNAARGWLAAAGSSVVRMRVVHPHGYTSLLELRHITRRARTELKVQLAVAEQTGEERPVVSQGGGTGLAAGPLDHLGRHPLRRHRVPVQAIPDPQRDVAHAR